MADRDVHTASPYEAMIKVIPVKVKPRPYKIYVGKNALKCLPGLIKTAKIGLDAVVITTPKVWALHGKKLKKVLSKTCTDILVLKVPDTEKSKSAGFAFNLIEKISRFDRKKKIFLAAFGGGVVGDLTGFIAAIYKRGIPYIQIPTTLLAQIDSAIGGKTAIDTLFGKNLVGAFYQPFFVLSDTSLLKTLPAKQLLAGLSEAVKYAVIKDPPLFSYLKEKYQRVLQKDPACLNHIVLRCASIKAGVVGLDEFDKKGIRMILNFGHTIGHAIEAASKFKINHGEAVSIGMVCAIKISSRLGLLPDKESSSIIDLIKKIGLPTTFRGLKEKAILKSLAYDKKFTKLNRFVLLEKTGKTKIVENVPEYLIRNVVREQSTAKKAD